MTNVRTTVYRDSRLNRPESVSLASLARQFTSNTAKYYESVGRIGTSAAGTSANTLSR